MNTNINSTVNGLRVCLCGCEEYVAGKAVYRPGHDARHVSITFGLVEELVYEAQDINNTSQVQNSLLALFGQLGSDALRAKLGRMIDNSKNGVDLGFGDNGIYIPFSDNQALPQSMIEEIENALVQVEPEDTVKIGRWTYPARNIDGQLERNTKIDGSGEWVAA